MALLLAKYAFLGIVPLVIPSIALDVPIPTNRIPDPAGQRPRIHPHAGRAGRLRVLPRSRSGAGHEHRVLGAEGEGRRAAAGVERGHGRGQQCRASSASATTATRAACRWSTSRTSRPRCRCRSRFPDIGPLNPPLGLIDPPPQQFRPLEETAKYSPMRAMLLGMAEAAKSADTVTGTRQPRRDPLRPRAEVAPAGRRARRRPRVRRPALRQPGAPHDQARRVQAELRAVAQGADFHRAAGAGMSTLLRQVPRHRGPERGPGAARPDPGDGAGRVRPVAVELGDAVRADRRQAERRLRGAADRRRRVDRVRAGRSGLPDLDRRLLGRGGRGAGAGAGRQSGQPEHRAAVGSAEHDLDQRPARADRRDPARRASPAR